MVLHKIDYPYFYLSNVLMFHQDPILMFILIGLCQEVVIKVQQDVQIYSNQG